MKEDLIDFYLAGRAVKSLSRLRKYLADPDEIAEKILAGTPVRAAISEACEAAAKQVEADRKRKAAWLADLAENSDSPLNGNGEAAWKAYCQGMADELAYAIDADVLDALEGEGDDDDDDDDEGDEGADDGGDDEADKKAPPA